MPAEPAPAYTRAQLPPELVLALDSAIDKLARAPVCMRLAEVSGYTDWALVLSARSERHVRGIVDGIRKAMSEAGHKTIGTDGLDEAMWALLDYGDFLVHIFYHPVRLHYDLESMWAEVPRAELDLPAEVMDTAELEGLHAPEAMPEYLGDRSFGGFEDEFVDDEDDDFDDEEDAFDEDVEDELDSDAPTPEPVSPDDDDDDDDDPLFDP